MDISIDAARGLFTKKLMRVYRERPRPTTFLRSFFTVKESSSKQLSIQVERGTEKVAVDVYRGTRGNRNTWDKSTEKIFIPPYYREYFNATDLEFYDRVFGEDSGGTVSAKTFSEWINEVADKLSGLQDIIERAYEVQASQVLFDGIVQLQAATNVDFKRTPASKVDLGGAAYWDQANTDPLANIETGCQYIRNNGKVQGVKEMIMIGGSSAIRALLKNDEFVEKANLRRVKHVDIDSPQTNADGGTLHGMISAGAYNLQVWSYPEIYEDDSLNKIPYIPDNKVTITVPKPDFDLGFAAVPMIYRDPQRAEYQRFIVNRPGQYHIGNYIDDSADAHIFEIKSAGLAIPVGVDQMYTMQVLA